MDDTVLISENSFEKQRRMRLTDSVDEYLSEENAGSEAFLKDLKTAIAELRQYHDKACKNYNHIESFFSNEQA